MEVRLLVKILTAILLLIAYSYVSYRVVKALKQSRSAGLFRTFANIPVMHLFFMIGALPFLLRDKLLELRFRSPKRRNRINSAEFTGNKESQVFHKQGCEYAEIMGYDKRVILESTEEAVKRGYRPCAACHPLGNINETK